MAALRPWGGEHAHMDEHSVKVMWAHLAHIPLHV